MLFRSFDSASNDIALIRLLFLLLYIHTKITLSNESSKCECIKSLFQACKELKLNLEGKLEFKSLDDALNEI